MDDIKILKQKIEEVRRQLNCFINENVNDKNIYEKSVELDKLIAQYIELEGSVS